MPTDEELIAAGWKAPPKPPLTEAELRCEEAALLREISEVSKREGPRVWALFGPDEDAVLLALHEREPSLVRHKITKRWGHMWRPAR